MGGFSLQNILSGVSFVISSGAIGYAIRMVIRIEVLEHLFNEKKEEMDELGNRQARSESDILRLKDSMTRIETSLERVSRSVEMLPAINEKLTTILDRVGTFVPKNEIEGQFNRLLDRIEVNAGSIKAIDTKLALVGRPNVGVDY